jgi:hypothetical protein
LTESSEKGRRNIMKDMKWKAEEERKKEGGEVKGAGIERKRSAGIED